MKRPLLLASVLALTVPLAGAGTAVAKPAAPAATGQAKVSTFWTPDRMRSAVPIEQLLPKGKLRRTTGKVALGKPQTVRPTAVRTAPQPPRHRWSWVPPGPAAARS